jgi:hypothetical protein
MGFCFITGFTEHIKLVTTSNYNRLTNLHTPKIAATTAHIKSSMTSLIIAK